MFKNLFHKNNKVFDVHAPVTGRAYAVSEVPDEVFAQKMLGDGFAVKPEANEIYAPVTGKISALFPTKHAIGITTSDGVEVLLHMGIDTVSLNGVPFDILVDEGDQVNADTELATVDLAYLREQKVHDDIIVIFTNMDKISDLSVTNFGTVSHSESVGKITVA